VQDEMTRLDTIIIANSNAIFFNIFYILLTSHEISVSIGLTCLPHSLCQKIIRSSHHLLQQLHHFVHQSLELVTFAVNRRGSGSSESRADDD